MIYTENFYEHKIAKRTEKKFGRRLFLDIFGVPINDALWSPEGVRLSCNSWNWHL